MSPEYDGARVFGSHSKVIAGVRLDEELVLKTSSSERDWEFESPARCSFCLWQKIEFGFIVGLALRA